MKSTIVCGFLSLVLLAGCDTLSMNNSSTKPTVSAKAAVAVTSDEVKATVAKANAGERWSQSRLASWYATGSNGFAKNDAKAVELYTLAADQGLAEAQTKLAAYYTDNKKGVKADPAKALALYLKAAQQGYGWAQYNAGHMLAGGKGINAPDYEGAYFWLKVAHDVKPAAAELEKVRAKLSPAQVTALDTRVAMWKPDVQKSVSFNKKK